MVGNDTSLSAPVSRRKLSSALTASISVSLPDRRFVLEPGEEARQRRAIALMGGARACDLGMILHRLHQRDRVGPARRLAAVLAQQAGEGVGRARLVEPHAFAP